MSGATLDGTGLGSPDGITRWRSASPYEGEAGFCRALRTGDRILVAGTAPVGPDGEPFAPGDAAAQARRCFAIAREAIERLGGTMDRVVRTRMYLTDAADWEAVARVHGEVFGGHPPVATCVVVDSLLDPAWLLEIEAEAHL